MRRVLVSSGKTLLVSGPASLSLLDGEAQVLGGPLEPGCKVIVREEKQMPVEATTNSLFELHLGEKARFVEIDGSTVPLSWGEAVGALIELQGGPILVIGDVDVGKSTLCAYLANRLFREGLGVAIVDADIGQTDLGPPTTIGRGLVKDYVPSLSSITADARLFIGHTNPSRVRAKVINCVKRLLSYEAEQASVTLVNTDGWVLDSDAVEYKARMTEELRPELVIGIASGRELDPILNSIKRPALLVHAPDIVRERDRENRRELRESNYRRYLDGGRRTRYRTDAVKLVAAESGRELSLRDIGGVEQLGNLSNLLLGLLDERGLLLEIGVLLGVDRGGEAVNVYSRPTTGVSTIELGSVKLSTQGAELGYLDEPLVAGGDARIRLGAYEKPVA